MKAPAERNLRIPRRPRFHLDRVWLARLALLAAVVAGLLLFAHVASRMFDSGAGKRIERFERAAAAGQATIDSQLTAPP